MKSTNKEIPRRRGKVRIRVLGLLSVFLLSTVQLASATENRHMNVASELTSLTYHEGFMFDNAKRYALLAVKDRFESNPKTKDYSDVLIGVVMEVLDAYFHDPHTQDQLKSMLTDLYVEEFTKQELVEFVKFYKTPAGQKALHKLPIVAQKGWERGAEIGSQVTSVPKYKNMLSNKIQELQRKGLLPEDLSR